jgi:hypothetical protein
LYGKKNRARTTSIVEGRPRKPFWTLEGLLAKSPPKWGRRVCVRGGGSARLLSQHISSILCRQPRRVLGLYSAPGAGSRHAPSLPPLLGGRAGRVASEALGSLDPRQCRSLWTLGRWPADPSFGSNPGEAALRHTPFAGGRAGVGPPFRGPYAAARPCPSGRWAEFSACGPALRSFRGGNLMTARAPPVRRAGSRRSGAACAPSV